MSATVVLGERSSQVLAAGRNEAVTQDFKDMCRVTGAPAEVVRPHQYCPSNNGDDVRPHLSFPSKSSLRRSPSPKSVVPSSQTKKSVRFAEEDILSQVSSQRFEKAKDAQIPCEPGVLTTTYEGVLPRASTMSPSEKADIWWQTRDYDIFSGTARLIAGEIRRRAAAISAAAARSVGSQEDGGGSNTRAHAESYAAVLTQVLQACSLAAASSSATTGDDEEDDVDIKAHPLDPNLFAYLAHWTRSGHSRRGLERWSIAYHGSKRNADRGAQIQAVLVAQASTLAEEDKDDKIKAASEAHSKSARLFALAIGQADAAAVNANCPS